MSKKYHIVYKTTNLVNGKCYVGVHSTNNLDDGYLGCGVRRGHDPKKFKRPRGIKFAFKKYGMHNFKREVLFCFSTRDEAFLKEAEIVDYEWVKSKQNYNLALGGKDSGTAKMTKRQKSKLIEIHSKEYVIVNIKTNVVYNNVKNLTLWCKNNLPELVYKKDKKEICLLRGVVSGTSKAYKNEWWACRKEDWTGKVVLKERKPIVRVKNYKKRPETKTHVNITLIDPYGCKVYVEDLVEFSAKNNIDYSSLVKMIKGKSLHSKYWTNSLDNHFKAVSYFLKSGKMVRVFNVKQFCRDNRLDSKSMFNIKSGKIKNYKEYTKYEKEI